ncbi:vomeronasal type-1 receptor 4-like [Peromyscus californicus insignis]|uniref:vomeronasal type-1 receptor 4-like n=1 Tax=Peromyscus californicus insignis TaxID=564181 RepID=UPI0022A71B25|nr:vomeronasal type-1 receptor 4-like [Peromyscus californicus insignis]
MDFRNLAFRIIFLSETTTGILGNSSLIFYYLVLYCRKCILKSTDLILMHLLTANALIILSEGVPQTMAAFGFKHFLDDFGCKLLLYFQGFGRSVSFGTTCLLSVFQAMTISPSKFCWKNHKFKFEKKIGCYIFLLWMTYMFINSIHFAYKQVVKYRHNNMTRKWDFEYCRSAGMGDMGSSIYSALVVFPEIFFSVLMTWSSGSMIVILYRHKKRVQHIRSTHGSIRNSPESRVTQNILILVSTFLAFYTLSSILRGYMALSYNQNRWLIYFKALISLFFPSFVPFLLLHHYSIVSKLCFFRIRNQNPLISF